MSEALPLMAAIPPSQASGQPVASLPGKTAPDHAGQGFPALFAAMNLPPQDPALAFLPELSMLPEALLADPAFAPLEPAVAGDVPPQSLQMFTAQLQQTGNELPQLGWAGVVAVADGELAQAVHLEGDDGGVVQARPVLARDLPTAVQRAQPTTFLPADASELPQLQALDIQQQLTGRELGGMRLERAFIADQVQPILQSSAPVSGTQHAQLAALLDGAVMVGTATRGEGVTQTVQLPVQHPQWGQQVSERVHWMITQNIKQADLRLNPPELGSLEVRIQVQGDQANVNFSSPHASVREALDAAMPRLREMLQDAGLSLGHANVSDQALAQRDSGQSGESHSGSGTAGAGDESGLGLEPAQTTAGRMRVGLVDLYA